MKIFIFTLIFLPGTTSTLFASIDKVLESYSEVAVAYVDSEKRIEDLVVVSGKRFSIKTINKEALGFAVTHPTLIKTRQIYLMLKGPKRNGISSERIIRLEKESKYIEEFGQLQLNDFLKHANSRKSTPEPSKP